MQDYDEVTAFLGQWGHFQQSVFVLLCASVLPNGFGAFSLIFLTDIPSHHCLVPNINMTEDWHQAIIPVEVNKFINSRAEVHDINLTNLEQEHCVDGWSYSKDVYHSTIVSEFDLVCTEEWKQPFTSTIYFLGVLVGSFFSGQLSDRFGRKPVLFVTMAIQTVFTFAQIFSPSWAVFCILLFISGLGQISNYVSAFVLGTEIFTGNVRVLFSSMGVCLAFAFGFMMLPLFAYFLRDWKSLLLGLSVPGLLYIPLWWLMPESPRWLLSQGRVEEAEDIVKYAAKINKVEPPQVIFEDFNLPVIHKKYPSSYQKKEKNLLSTGYFGLSLNTSRLHADPFISCFISAAVEVPAYISSWLALRYLRRQLSVILYSLTKTLHILYKTFCFSPLGLSYLSIALEMLGKFGITTGTALMFAYTAELYPTVVRNTATGMCTTVSRVGSCIAPFLLKLGEYFKYLPYIILGTLAVVSAFAAVFLPEKQLGNHMYLLYIEWGQVGNYMQSVCDSTNWQK
uniref:Major facilitator superfamily (MFS) profile domain-containing protein n=1 Tax=Amphilophus citrinellus TaxID=61819 RepID=A0A3Q0SCZ7_AMPCI